MCWDVLRRTIYTIICTYILTILRIIWERFPPCPYLTNNLYLSDYENSRKMSSFHCLTSVRIWSYSGPHSVWMRENTDQNNSKYGQFSRSLTVCMYKLTLIVNNQYIWPTFEEFEALLDFEMVPYCSVGKHIFPSRIPFNFCGKKI